MISRGEVHGGSKKTLYFAAGLYGLVIASVVYFAVVNEASIPITMVFLAGFAAMIMTPLFKAIRNPIGPNIGKAVKAGVIALIILNAAWAAAFGAWPIAIAIIILLPISLALSAAFAVT